MTERRPSLTSPLAAAIALQASMPAIGGLIDVGLPRQFHRGIDRAPEIFDHIEPTKDKRAKVKAARRQNVRRMQK